MERNPANGVADGRLCLQVVKELVAERLSAFCFRRSDGKPGRRVGFLICLAGRPARVAGAISGS
jgi:hypothetical protein